MQIYNQLQPIGKLKKFFLFRENSLLSWLIGINVNAGGDAVGVQPVYRTLFRHQSYEGQLIIELYLGKDKCLVVSFSGRGIEFNIGQAGFPTSEEEEING